MSFNWRNPSCLNRQGQFVIDGQHCNYRLTPAGRDGGEGGGWYRVRIEPRSKVARRLVYVQGPHVAEGLLAGHLISGWVRAHEMMLSCFAQGPLAQQV